MKAASGRHVFILGMAASLVAVASSRIHAEVRTTWSAGDAYHVLLPDSARVIDVRSREERMETGVGAGI